MSLYSTFKGIEQTLQRKSMSYSEYSKFYLTLQEMMVAGVPIVDALANAVHWVKGEHKRMMLHRLKMAVSQGKTFSESLRMTHLFPYFDCSIIEAAEQSGMLPAALEKLAQRYVHKELALKSAIQKLAYPAFLTVSALFLLNIPDLVMDKISGAAFLGKSAGAMVVFSIVAFILLKVYRTLSQKPEYEGIYGGLQRFIPIIGSLLKNMALEEYFYALSLLTNAGVNIQDASRRASIVGNNLRVKRAAGMVALKIKNGEGLTSAFSSGDVFTPEMLTYINTAESTGNYSSTFENIAQKQGTLVESRIAMISAALPKLIYLIVVCMVGYKIVDGFEATNPYEDIQ